jgi:hypothetical protein
MGLSMVSRSTGHGLGQAEPPPEVHIDFRWARAPRARTAGGRRLNRHVFRGGVFHLFNPDVPPQWLETVLPRVRH